jgi:hypothetical protein
MVVAPTLLWIGLLLGASDAGSETAPPAPTPPAVAEAPDYRQQFSGTFVYSGGEAEKAARETAIADATNGVFFVIRGIVGARVNDKTKISPELTFSFPAGKISAASPGRPDIVTPDDGSKVTLNIDGEKIDVSQTLKGPTLTQIFTAGDGVRTNVMTVEEGGKAVKVKVTVKSGKLPHNLIYGLTYKRQ